MFRRQGGRQSRRFSSTPSRFGLDPATIHLYRRGHYRPVTRYSHVIKKKAPVIPLTIVVLGLAIIFGFNAMNHPVDPKDMAAQQKAAAASQQDGKTRPADTTADLKEAMGSELHGGGAPSGAPAASKMGGAPKGQLMSATKQQAYRPKPSPTSTDAQWYNH